MSIHTFHKATLLLVVVAMFGCKDDDATPADLPTFVLQDKSIDEGNSNQALNLVVKLDKPTSQEVTVKYRTQEGTAKPDEDYVATSGTLVFASNETEKTLSLSIVSDEIREGDEVFYVIFEDPTNANIFSFSSDITIVNDDRWLPIVDAGATSPNSYAGYNLVWADEFATQDINPDNWVYDLGDGCPNICGWGNNELEYYTDSDKNSLVIDGFLVLEAHLEQKGGRNYTSARMKSKGKQQFKECRIDIRAKLPQGQGIWPALWMLGANIDTEGWPKCGEIDIMEYLGHETDKVYGTAHWGDTLAQHAYKTGFFETTGANFNEEFHVFSVDWTENYITWLVDDTPYFTLVPQQLGGASWPFDKDFYFLFNIAVGGNWPGAPNNDTQFPQRMFIDYVRVFEKQ